jgi:hypothetical protein
MPTTILRNRSCKLKIEITPTGECKSQRHLNAAWRIELIQRIFATAAPTETHIMKASSLVSLICCLTINGVNSLYQPAAARELPQPTHIAEAVTSAKQKADETEKYVLFREGTKYGYADDEDYEVIAAQFDNAYEFFDGLAGVKIGSKWGFIDREGKTVIAMQFDGASSFHAGLAAVKIADKWGFIDRTGKLVIAAEFDEAETFSDGLAKVKLADKWGFIDRQGTIAISATFDEVASFNDNTAWVRIGKQVGYIDKTGKFVQ